MYELVTLGLMFIAGIGIGILISALLPTPPPRRQPVPPELMPVDVDCPPPRAVRQDPERSPFAPKPKPVRGRALLKEFMEARAKEPPPAPESRGRLPPIEWDR
jgi:hypothetical protein